MRLGELLPLDADLAVSVAQLEVCGVTQDSRRVQPGDLYVAVRGQSFDGRCFVPEALRRGAVAVLAEDAPLDTVAVPWLTVPKVRPLLAPLAAQLYDHPDRKLCLVGITGTNGKSTVATLVGRVMEAASRPTGVLGTLGYRFAGRSFGGSEDNAGQRTTPEATELYRILAAMWRQGAEAVAMEVSSHALQLGRVEGLEFQVGVFTNLTHDHLDFHGDMESYFQAKCRLFDQLRSDGQPVICVDGELGRRLAAKLPGAMTFGRDGLVAAEHESLDYSGMRLQLRTPRGPLAVQCPLLGNFNRDNVLAAVAVGEALQLPQEAIVEGLLHQPPLPGRLEPVDAGQDFPALVDYAHTPDALRAALDALRQLGDHKLAVVFGCGGDRDKTKRRPMGQIVGERAELPVVTSDNPRGEDPDTILMMVEEGLKLSGNTAYRTLVDRRQAIREAVAVAVAEGGWAVLVAGRGHETLQILADRAESFDDRLELALAIRQAMGRRGGDPNDPQAKRSKVEVSHGGT